MPGGIEITLNDKPKRLYFPVPDVTLPVLKKTEAIPFLLWGRRNDEEGLLPPGGWARLDSIKKGTWEHYHPVPVKIPATGWMEKDDNGTSHYFPLKNDECIQGLVATKGIEIRLYIVTVGASETADIHPRAPRIIQHQKPSVFYRPTISNQDVPINPGTPEVKSDVEQPTSPTNDIKQVKVVEWDLPSWTAHLSHDKRLFLQCLATIGDNSHEAIAIKKNWREERRRHGKSDA